MLERRQQARGADSWVLSEEMARGEKWRFDIDPSRIRVAGLVVDGVQLEGRARAAAITNIDTRMVEVVVIAVRRRNWKGKD